MQRVNFGQVVQHAALDGVEGSARAGLFRRLEDQPDAPGQQIKITESRQHHAGTEQNRGMHVVPAGVTYPRVLGGVVNVLAVLDGQRVDVGTQAHRAFGTAVLDDADHAGLAHGASR